MYFIYRFLIDVTYCFIFLECLLIDLSICSFTSLPFLYNLLFITMLKDHEIHVQYLVYQIQLEQMFLFYYSYIRY